MPFLMDRQCMRQSEEEHRHNGRNTTLGENFSGVYRASKVILPAKYFLRAAQPNSPRGINCVSVFVVNKNTTGAV